MDYLKVSSKSSPASVAGAIAGMVKDGLPVEIQAVGAGAVNQSIKAVAIARGFLVPTGYDVWCSPSFQDIEIDGERRTAIRISVRPRLIDPPASPAPILNEGVVDRPSRTAMHQDDDLRPTITDSQAAS
jgi:stage V sporulation protein S